MCRALVPVIVMAISMFYYGKSFSIQRKLSVLPIVFGVALAFYGDLSFTPVGAFYTLLCVVLAALKAVAGGELLTGDLKLHEIDLLSKMCPLALLQIGLLSVLTGKYRYVIISIFLIFSHLNSSFVFFYLFLYSTFFFNIVLIIIPFLIMLSVFK